MDHPSALVAADVGDAAAVRRNGQGRQDPVGNLHALRQGHRNVCDGGLGRRCLALADRIAAIDGSEDRGRSQEPCPAVRLRDERSRVPFARGVTRRREGGGRRERLLKLDPQVAHALHARAAVLLETPPHEDREIARQIGGKRAPVRRVLEHRGERLWASSPANGRLPVSAS